ncbi:hypothetical protein SAMN05216388_101784 [Halorientalis persicus]|uniref:Uncharacterized protein n=1 Tax=Halorientalis persicus TaxID=1367881 RepID=A0A1H8RYN1_9EURY|nr:hypothetical protein [Halorientalis persicus]SEO71485.1 hypothetical protein SAMN05216388_101784 [Halorientalis persicus]
MTDNSTAYLLGLLLVGGVGINAIVTESLIGMVAALAMAVHIEARECRRQWED